MGSDLEQILHNPARKTTRGFGDWYEKVFDWTRLGRNEPVKS